MFSLSAQTPRQDSGANGLFTRESTTDSLRRNLLDVETAISKKRYSDTRLRVKYPYIDFKRYPFYIYNVDTTKIGYIRKGETIPDRILDMPLRMLNMPNGQTTTTLRELSNQEFLVLDLWAEYCAPCIKSMDKWEALYPKIKNKMQVVGVVNDAEYKGIVKVHERHWTRPQIIGPTAPILARYFTLYGGVGPSIWIKNGKLFGRTSSKPVDPDYIFRILEGKLDHIPDFINWDLDNQIQ
jgi:thiol-disulfide isomerase/thioredoxin